MRTNTVNRGGRLTLTKVSSFLLYQNGHQSVVQMTTDDLSLNPY